VPKLSLKSAKELLDAIVSICLICACIAVLAMGIRYFRDSRAQAEQAKTAIAQSLYKGQVLDVDAIRGQSPHKPVLLVALREGCRFCKESTPLYKKLVEHSNALNAQIVFVFGEPVSQASHYLQSNDIRSSNVEQIDFRKIHVNGTPTLILLDTNNRVIDYWVGELQDAETSNLFKSLGLPG